MATRSRKPAAPPVKKLAVKRAVVKKTAAQKPVAKKKTRVPAVFRVDLSAFPPESVISSERSLCVACVWQIFTRAMSLAPKTALSEMKRYTPTFEELTSAEAVRPFLSLMRRNRAPTVDRPQNGRRASRPTALKAAKPPMCFGAAW